MVVLACLSIILGFESHAQTPYQLAAANAFVEAFTGGQWDRLIALQHPSLLEKIKPAEWKALAEKLEQQGGPFRAHRFLQAELQHSYASVVHRVWYRHDSVDVRMVVDSLNLVDGFWLDPIRADLFPPPPYALAASFHEESVIVGDSVRLLGILTLPEGRGPFAAVVLLHGAGPHDKDATFLRNKIFRDIAQGLATRGVAVLRYDKRTRVYDKTMDLTTLTVEEETLDDAWSAIRMLLSRKDIDTARLSLVGHGTGGMLVPRLASMHPEIKGIGLLAAPARRLEDALLDQFSFLAHSSDSLSASRRSTLDLQIRTVQSLRERALPPTTMIGDVPASYYYALQDYDQTAVAASCPVPILVVQGGKDFQTPAGEFDLWKNALAQHPDTRYLLCEKCYHQLIETDADPSPRNFTEAGHVSLAVIRELASWAKRK
jgi:uncharacterized protein